MSSHCPCNKSNKANKANKETDKKVKNLKTKNLKAQNLLACNIETQNINTQSANISDLTSNSLSVTNLNATTINGRNLFCDNEFKISGVITPVQYVNGEPVQPDNTGNFDQRVIDQLWQLNLLANGFTNLDAADTRYKNYLLQQFYGCRTCPNFPPIGCVFKPNQTALFTGSVSGSAGVSGSNNILTVSKLLPVNIITGTTGSAEIGIIQIGQRVYPETAETYFVIQEQLSGNPGGVGTYRVDNGFNSAINLQSQRMLALKSNGLEECAAIPLRIYGLETIPYSSANIGMSGMSGAINGCRVSVVEAINYNINIANKVLTTRVAAVYLQVGWLGANNRVVVQGLSVDTKQFDLSILSFGEQMNNNFLIPDNIRPDPLTAVVQIAVYVEDGLEVLIPEDPTVAQGNTRNSRDVKTRAVAAPGQANNYTVSFSSLASVSVCSGFPETQSNQVTGFKQPPLLGVVNTKVQFPANITGTIFFEVNGFYFYNGKSSGSADITNIGESTAVVGSTVSDAVATVLRVILYNSSFVQPKVGSNVMVRFVQSSFNVPSNNCILAIKRILLVRRIGETFDYVGVYDVLSISNIDAGGSFEAQIRLARFFPNHQPGTTVDENSNVYLLNNKSL